MKYTLLDMVQEVLSAIDGDEVNSFSDTVESEQVARVIRRTYYDIASHMELPELETVFSLDASTDSTKPVVMTLPTRVTHLEWIKYDKKEDADVKPSWEEICFCPLDEFVQRMGGLSGESDTTTDVMNLVTASGSFEFLYSNNKHPSYYTVIGDNTLVFDSYDVTIESTLQEANTMCFGKVYTDFQLNDTFVPDLDATQFSYLLNKAIAVAFVEIKQQDNPTARREARDQKITSQKSKRTTPFGGERTRIPQYGRK